MSNSLIVRPTADPCPADVLQEIAVNPEPRFPYVVIADRSASMRGAPINEVNRGFADLAKETSSCPVTRRRAEIAVVSFGGDVQLESEFCPAHSFVPPVLIADGLTPMAEAIHLALAMTLQRLEIYHAASLDSFKATALLLTDGAPTSPPAEIKHAAQHIRELEHEGKLAFFAVATEHAAMDSLRRLSVRQPVRLRDARFREMFRWMSQSIRGVSCSQIGEEIELPNPLGPDGWATL